MIKLNDLLELPLPLVLASRSPRRQALLTHVGYDFSIVVPDVDEETVPVELPPDEYVERLALMKAERGADIVGQPSIVIGSDTTVVLDGEILNKPEDPHHAREMLRMLSGRTHTVYTGLALVASDQHIVMPAVTSRLTDVTVRDLDVVEIEAYVAGGSPMDKAGAYGIQDDFGAVFVSRVEGCYYTIVGLPLELLYTTLRAFSRQLVSHS